MKIIITESQMDHIDKIINGIRELKSKGLRQFDLGDLVVLKQIPHWMDRRVVITYIPENTNYVLGRTTNNQYSTETVKIKEKNIDWDGTYYLKDSEKLHYKEKMKRYWYPNWLDRSEKDKEQ